MVIDKFYYMSLDYRLDRHVSMETAAALCDIPYSLVNRFPACFGNERVPDSLEEVVSLMDVDGFPEWRWWLENDPTYDCTWVCSAWTKLSLLRLIANSSENAFFFSDTYLPHNFSFLNLEGWFGLLHKPKCLFLNIKFDSNFIKSTLEYADVKFSAVPGIYTLPACYLSPSAIMTPEGANAVLNLWREYPQYDFTRFAYFSGLWHKLTGLYCTIPPMAKNVANSSDYPFSRSDKLTGGDTYYEHDFGGAKNEDASCDSC